MDADVAGTASTAAPPIELFEKGYGKDAAEIAKHAVAHGARRPVAVGPDRACVGRAHACESGDVLGRRHGPTQPRPTSST